MFLIIRAGYSGSGFRNISSEHVLNVRIKTLSIQTTGKISTGRRLSSLPILNPWGTDLVKVIALAAMITDHINTVLLSSPRLELYALGRTAFPLFALIWAMNVCRDPARLQLRARRLWIWAVATQPVFTLTFQGLVPWYALNILFVFAGVTQLLALRHSAGKYGALCGLVLLAIMVWPLTPASYGIPGLALSLSLALWFALPAGTQRNASGFTAVISLAMLNGVTHLTDAPLAALVFTVIPTMLLPAVAVNVVEKIQIGHTQRFMHRHFFYLAYAGHLIVLSLIRYFS